MKQRAFALILALCMVLTVLPGFTFGAELQALPEPVMAPAALPETRVQPMAETYSITMTYSGPGVAELYATSAGAREYVHFLADPDPGYRMDYSKSRFYHTNYTLEWNYIGNNEYVITMPDGDVSLDLEFVPIESDSHDITLTVSEGGTATVDQQSAKAGESIFVAVDAAPGYSRESVRARSESGWNEGYYLKTVDGKDLFEIFMPDEALEIIVSFKRNGPYTITSYIDSDPAGGTVELSHETAYELEEISVTAKPDRGYQVTNVACYHSAVTKVKENIWTFAMPKFKEEVHVTFEPILYPVSVTTELEMGGKAYLDMEGATIGQTVTLTCVPDEGYRVAQITGAELTDNGDNTYSFVMDNAPVELSVLFLRENNPFLDVNENHFFYDSVIWAMENGITTGVDATHFGPLEACNRAQVVTFLWRAAGSPAPVSGVNPFTDVPEGTWFTDAVLWAVETGITNGLTETTFGPTTVCNRAQVVTFLYRSCGSPKINSAENPFTDVPEGSFFRNAVLWALENGVTTGASATTFDPAGECLRAHVVTFLYRADQIPEPEPDPLPFPGLG